MRRTKVTKEHTKEQNLDITYFWKHVGYFKGKLKYFKKTSKEMKYFKKMSKGMIYLLKKVGLLLKETDNDILLRDGQRDKRACKGG